MGIVECKIPLSGHVSDPVAVVHVMVGPGDTPLGVLDLPSRNLIGGPCLSPFDPYLFTEAVTCSMHLLEASLWEGMQGLQFHVDYATMRTHTVHGPHIARDCGERVRRPAIVSPTRLIKPPTKIPKNQTDLKIILDLYFFIYMS